jgi:hypothetical protein
METTHSKPLEIGGIKINEEIKLFFTGFLQVYIVFF